MALLNVPKSSKEGSTFSELNTKTAECSHVKNHVEIKISESNFGEFMVICQIC